MTKVKVVMLRDKIVAGEPVRTGETYSLERKEALYMINRGHAELAPETKPKAKAKKSPTNRMADVPEAR